MKIDYVAFDSFGVKSSCIKVITKDICITIDPGIAAEVNSFPISELEKAKLDLIYTRRIKKSCKSWDKFTFEKLNKIIKHTKRVAKKK